jgi:glycosyltransferase involved in cell wall biosynthesis
MCRALRRQGVETSLATTDADGPGRLPVPYGVETDYEGVPAVFFPRRLGEGFKLSVGLARWLSGAVAQFDVVHIHALFSHSSLAAARACRRHGVPSVVCPHGMLDPWALGQKRLRKRSSR